jgi:hypothetical protein
MGLDMYLTKRHYVKNWDHNPKEQHYQITVKQGGKKCTAIDTNKICSIIEDVHYWRKANAIHKWFIDHVQDGDDDCKEYYVSQKYLKELLNDINTVLTNHDQAEEFLPHTNGFFFVGNEYDEWYFKDLEETKKMLETELAIKDNMAEYYYTSSW